MRRNEPVTGQEVLVDPKRPLVSKTNLKGQIVYANQAFIEISGFSWDELNNQPHNIVRHPDMPPAAFADLWKTTQSGLPWRGLVKNRCKNGDHYWVEAFVTPLTEDGRHIGYMSVRNSPTREQLSAAERLYADINAARASMPPTHWPQELQVQAQLAIVLLPLCLLCIATVFSRGPLAWGLSALAVVVAIAGWLWLRAGVQKVTRRIAHALQNLAEGNFRFGVDSKAPAEFAHLLVQLEGTRINLRAIIADVLSAANLVGERAKLLATDSHTLMSRSAIQSDGVANVAAALQELTVSVREIHHSTEQSSAHASSANELTHRGTGEMAAARDATRTVINVVDEARETITQLNLVVTQISKVTQTIREIADQTNLLALNAAIEAARAGEQGRGFAVVADEVRKLAERTSESTIQITQTIQSVEQRTEQAMQAMQQAVSAVHSGNTLIEDCARSLEEIATASAGVDQAARDVTGTLDQQAHAASEVATSMERISTLTEQNTRTIATVDTAADELAAVAGKLHQMLSHFQKAL